VGTLKLPIFSISTESGEILTPQKTIQVEQAAHDTTQTEEGDVKVENNFSKTTVYSGEQVLLTTKLTTAVRLENLQFPNASDINFWSEAFSSPKQYREENSSGQTVTVMEQLHAIYPLIKQGTLVLPPQTVTAQAQIAADDSDSFFDNLGTLGSSIFRGGIFSGLIPFELQPITISTKPLELNVIELPKRTSPQGQYEIKYSPVLVGETNISLSIDTNHITSNDGATLKLVITSLGNVNSLRKLSFPNIPDFEIESVQENIGKTHNNSSELTGVYTGLFTIIPKTNGSLTFPPIELTFFNPNTGQYETIQTPEISITADGIQEQERQVLQPSVDSKDENLTQSEILDNNSDVEQQSEPATSHNRIYILLGTAFLIVLTLLFFNQSRATKVNFKLPDPSQITTYSDLIKLVEEFNNQIGSLKQFSRSLDPHFQMALDILTESKYNPNFEYDQKIFNTTRDTILSLCQLMLKQKKKR
jgi:hypothetical protein